MQLVVKVIPAELADNPRSVLLVTSPTMPSAQKRTPLPSLTRRLEDLARSGRLTVARFRREATQLASHIESDAQTSAIRALWGRTRNFDENAQKQIVHPDILRCIGAIGSTPMNGTAVHSGSMHTYGYLLTNLRTPYGFKRTRWTTPDLGRGLGVGNRTLRPYPSAGTLLANLTWVLGKIAFDEHGTEASRLRKLSRAISPDIIDWIPDRVSRLTETIECRSIAGLERAVLQTDLVPLIAHPLGDHLLAYSLRRASTGKSETHRLLTAFPVTAEVVKTIGALPRSREPIRLRYNAADSDLSGAELRGQRRLHKV